MSGFTAPAASPGAATISNDGWWPDVDPDAFRAQHRLDGTVTDPRLRAALITAIARTNRELAAWRTSHEASGITSLADVPADAIDDTSILVHLYLSAVYSAAHALLVERYRNYDITADGQKEADQQTPSIDELRRDARWAISDILVQTHTTVELI